ncbi:helix-turn-helix domain-containing protein [Streptomyces sp. ST2-7A]|uniref:PucR family transcriptional regulator n=1 Tax=Streptomyces sp. ST2-7A TaxID=2907214 RepID=UPI001F2380A5|nr:helix-turn-helix domain-containing protein [Streptomyces sp. ST2-7A]MCE7082049.1 helix-turn-helix domain-containing protein [Streptomyces sp. ST2-7A]
MRLRDLLDVPELGLRPLGGRLSADRPVRGTMTTDLRDPGRYLVGGELVLTGLAWWRGPGDAEPFVRILAGAGVAALAAGEAELGSVPPDLVEACARHGLPLLAVDTSVGFATITEYVSRRLSGTPAGELAAVLERRRRGGPLTGGPEPGPRARLVSPTGRITADTTGEPAPPELAALLLRARSGAVAAGGTAPARVTVAGVPHALFPVAPTGPDGAPPPLGAGGPAGELLAVVGDPAGWPRPRVELLVATAALLAEERRRADAAGAAWRRLAREVIELARSGASSAAVAARLDLLAPLPRRSGREPGGRQVVVARVERDGQTDGSGTRSDARTARLLLTALLEDLRRGADTAGGAFGAPGSAEAPGGPAGAVVTEVDGEAVALLAPLPDPAPGTDPIAPLRAAPTPAALTPAALLDAARPALTAALGPGCRLGVGISDPVASADGLAGALEEARHARRVAAARGEAVGGAGPGELASHVLLLPFVPAEVRRAFTARLLDPLSAYDRRRHAELLPTLRAFLEADGSWSRCAERLHVHVNTLRYRIRRIGELTGRDPTRWEDRVDFFLALRMHTPTGPPPDDPPADDGPVGGVGR